MPGCLFAELWPATIAPQSIDIFDECTTATISMTIEGDYIDVTEVALHPVEQVEV